MAVLIYSSTKEELTLYDINVFWRRNDSEIMHDIFPSSHLLGKQDPDYENRTERFPGDYLRGNSKLKNFNKFMQENTSALSQTHLSFRLYN